MFKILMGVPEMAAFWCDLEYKCKNEIASKNEKILYEKIRKTLKLLRQNPMYPSLNTHEIKVLSAKYGFKVWESYIENHKSKARRIFWAYGKNSGEITILSIEPHPEDKSNSYKKIKLSSFIEDE